MDQEDKIIRITTLIKNIGLILGVPVLILVGITLYETKVGVLESQIELLERGQYSEALNTIESQEKLYEKEKKRLEDEINKLKGKENIKDAKSAISTTLGTVLSIKKELELLRSKSGILSQSLFQSVSHIMIDLPVKLFEIDGSITVQLEEIGVLLSVVEGEDGRVCGIGKSFSLNGKVFYASLCTPGYSFIHHDIEVEIDRSFVNRWTLHLEISIAKEFEILVRSYMEIVNPDVTQKSNYINKESSEKLMLYTCPFFMVLNKAYHKRYILCDVSASGENNVIMQYLKP